MRNSQYRFGELGSSLLKCLGSNRARNEPRRRSRQCRLEQLEKCCLLSTGITMFPVDEIEGTFPASFSVELYGEDNSQEVRVDYRTLDGTARGGADYSAQSGTLVFPPHAFRDGIWEDFTVPILDDTLYED